MDGTLADYTGQLMHDLEELRSPYEPVVSPEDEGKYSWLKARIRLIKSQPNWWLNLPRLKAGFEIVNALRMLDYELHILTRGPYKLGESWTQKFQWCRTYISDADITITHDKSLVYGRVLVDDWPDYIKGWLEYRPRGLVIMPDQPWNQGFEHPQVIRFKHGENLEEVVQALKLQRNQND